MSSPTTIRTGRLAAGLLAGGLALAGCSFTSHNVSCSTSSCSVTLTGDGAEAEIFGNSLSFGGIQDGRASLSVGGASVSCAEGESVTYDMKPTRDDPTAVGTSQVADAIIEKLEAGVPA